MTLSDYMAANNLRDWQMAEMLGVSRPQVSRYRSGKSYPPKEVAEVLVRVTNGAVTANDFLEMPAPDERGAA